MVALLSFQNVPPAPGRETSANTVAPSAPADKGAPGAPPRGAEGGLGGMLPMLIMVVPLILLMVFTSRSNSKKQKKVLESLQKGDRVITQGGIHGVVTGIKSGVVQVKIAENVKVDVTRSAITTVLQDSTNGNGAPAIGEKLA